MPSALPAGDVFGVAGWRALNHVLSLGDDGDRAQTAREAREAMSALPS